MSYCAGSIQNANKIKPDSNELKDSKFGQIEKPELIIDYILLRGVSSQERYSYYPNSGAKKAVVRRNFGGLDNNFKELKLTADRKDFRLGGTIIGMEESGAKLFIDKPIMNELYIGSTLAVLSSRQKNEEYQLTDDETFKSTRIEKWNNHYFGIYGLYLKDNYEASFETGLLAKRRSVSYKEDFKSNAFDSESKTSFHQDFKGGYFELKLSYKIPISRRMTILFSYAYYKEEVHKGKQSEDDLNANMNGYLEHHNFDLVHLRVRI